MSIQNVYHLLGRTIDQLFFFPTYCLCVFDKYIIVFIICLLSLYFRLFVLEPIPFHKSINFILEGNTSGKCKKKSSQTLEQYLLSFSTRRHNDKDVIDMIPDVAYVTLYYSSKGSQLEQGQTLKLGDEESEKIHDLEISPNILTECDMVVNSQFIFNRVNNRKYTYKYRKFSQDNDIIFTMKNSVFPNAGAYLRRTYIAPLGAWNFEARISINNIDHGVWFIPKGTTNADYVLAQDNFPIAGSVLDGRNNIVIKIQPLTVWWDAEYTIYFIKK